MKTITVSKKKYNPAFLKKIKESEKQIKDGKFTILDNKDLLGSLMSTSKTGKTVSKSTIINKLKK